MTVGPDNGKPYSDGRMTAITQATVHKTVSAKFETVNFEIDLHQTLDYMVSSIHYVVRVTKALLDTDKFLEPVVYVVRTEADKIIDVSKKREEQIKYSYGSRRTR